MEPGATTRWSRSKRGRRLNSAPAGRWPAATAGFCESAMSAMSAMLAKEFLADLGAAENYGFWRVHWDHRDHRLHLGGGRWSRRIASVRPWRD